MQYIRGGGWKDLGFIVNEHDLLKVLSAPRGQPERVRNWFGSKTGALDCTRFRHGNAPFVGIYPHSRMEDCVPRVCQRPSCRWGWTIPHLGITGVKARVTSPWWGTLRTGFFHAWSIRDLYTRDDARETQHGERLRWERTE